jgi:hypothetical protein
VERAALAKFLEPTHLCHMKVRVFDLPVIIKLYGDFAVTF